MALQLSLIVMCPDLGVEKYININLGQQSIQWGGGGGVLISGVLIGGYEPPNQFHHSQIMLNNARPSELNAAIGLQLNLPTYNYTNMYAKYIIY